jgi:hypothetical protein
LVRSRLARRGRPSTLALRFIDRLVSRKVASVIREILLYCPVLPGSRCPLAYGTARTAIVNAGAQLRPETHRRTPASLHFIGMRQMPQKRRICFKLIGSGSRDAFSVCTASQTYLGLAQRISHHDSRCDVQLGAAATKDSIRRCGRLLAPLYRPRPANRNGLAAHPDY